MTPTGILLDEGGRPVLRITRHLSAPVDDVWAALTESARMERWIGTWSGDPTTGAVMFAMTAEGADVRAEEVRIRECDPPHVLRVTSRFGDEAWHLDVVLIEDGGGTTLVFEQPDVDVAQLGEVGPGWEYYLDRLLATVTGADVGAIDWDRDYYPAMKEHYDALAR